MKSKNSFLRSALASATIIPISTTWAQVTSSFTTLHSFAALSGAANSDGTSPQGDLALGSDGNFYGTTECGEA